MNCNGEIRDVNGRNELVDEDSERRHFERIVAAFKYYRSHSMKRVMLANKYFNELPAHHRALLPHFKENLDMIRTCIEHNYEIIKIIISCTDHMFENGGRNSTNINKKINEAHHPSDFDMDKVKSTLKQFVRDWSSDGQTERNTCYQPVVDELLRLYPGDESRSLQSRSSISVLVPGAGLGRLAYEIARHGYSCQGNEFSLFMLFASNFILNSCKNVNAFTLYPWVHQYCNNMSSDHQTQAINFPDANPADMPSESNFSMAAGDFLEVYTEPDTWDCVATVFFIDTAHNIIAYIETIHRILKDGGHWINFGPLLYHFADMPNESSIELSYEDLREIILKFNFEFLREETHVPCGYTDSTHSMLRYRYDCVFFVVRKRPSDLSNGTSHLQTENRNTTSDS